MDTHPTFANRDATRSAQADDGAEAARTLTPSERLRCRVLPERRRPDFRAGRLAAKRAVHRLVGGTEESAVTVRSGCGRPPTVQLGGVFDAPSDPLRISIAHRDGHGFAAAGRGVVRLGVDLERRAHPGPLRHFLGEEERETAPPRLDATDLWALKEAAWKALGLSRSECFHALVLVFEDDPDSGERVLAGLRHAGRRWAARGSFLRPWPRYVATVVRALPRGAS